MKSRCFPRTAFTLIEILSVIAILAILVALAVGAMNRARAVGQNTKCLSNLRSLGAAMLSYAGENNGELPNDRTVPPGSGFLADGHAWMRGALNPYLGIEGLLPAQSSSGSFKGTVYECPAARSGTGPNGASLSAFPGDSGGKYRDIGFARNYIWSMTPTGGTGTEDGSRINFRTLRIPNYTVGGSEVERLSRFPLLMDANHYNIAGGADYTSRFALRHSNRANAVFADGHVRRVGSISNTAQFTDFIRGKGDPDAK